METRLSASGPVAQSIHIHASETRYTTGQVLAFRSKRDVVVGVACDIRTADH